MALAEVMTLANKSSARNRVIVLDSCHSGAAGDHPLGNYAEINDGVTILTASAANQYALESGDGSGGVYTGLFVDAMGGAAANLVGVILPAAYTRTATVRWGLGAAPVFKDKRQGFRLPAKG